MAITPYEWQNLLVSQFLKSNSSFQPFFLKSNSSFKPFFLKSKSSFQPFLVGSNSSSNSHNTSLDNTFHKTQHSTVVSFFSCQTIFLDDVSQCKYRVLNLPIFWAKLTRCYILILKNRVENDSKADAYNSNMEYYHDSDNGWHFWRFLWFFSWGFCNSIL